jgi:precorrin isomerase
MAGLNNIPFQSNLSRYPVDALALIFFRVHIVTTTHKNIKPTGTSANTLSQIVLGRDGVQRVAASLNEGNAWFEDVPAVAAGIDETTGEGEGEPARATLVKPTPTIAAKSTQRNKTSA